MARALHDAAVQSPLAICGTSVLAAAAVASQGLRDVVLPLAGGLSKPLSLYFLIIARSGERKTATDALALTPLRQRALELREDYDVKIADYRNTLDVWTSERACILKKKIDAHARKRELDVLGSEPKPPKTPILTLSEPTIEGLTKHLKQGYPSLGLFSSEGGQFIGGYAMSDDAKRRSAAALNAIWDDGRLERIRASDEAVILPGRRLSVFLQAQPEVAHRFLSDPILQDIGLLLRFLITQPETTMGSRPHRELTTAHEAAIAAYTAKTLELLRHPLPYDERGEALKPPPLKMTDDARQRWIALSDYVDAALKPGFDLSEITGFASKIAEHAARIGGVLTVYDDPAVEYLDRHHLEHGIALANFYASETIRLFSVSSVRAELKQAETLLNLLQRSWHEPHVTIRVILRRGPKPIRDKAMAERLVAILEAHGWLWARDDAIVEGKPVRKAWAIYGKGQ